MTIVETNFLQVTINHKIYIFTKDCVYGIKLSPAICSVSYATIDEA
uniref:Uncharacterized protein n=1 Tax=Anguilla anguilla TaxID=7936 RepID=A0A0E9Q405_ANGAN